MAKTCENEILAKIEKLENKIFILGCKDFWDAKDYQENAELRNELIKLKNELRNIEKRG